MAELIIGHTDHESTTIWVRGEKRERWVRLELQNLGDKTRVLPVDQRLSFEKDYTWSHRFTNLEAKARYEVIARFSRTKWGLDKWRFPNGRKVTGQLRTFPETGNEEPFSFLHGSCNLSTVRITNTGGLAAAILGLLAGKWSLGRLLGSGEEGRSGRIRTVFRHPLGVIYLWCSIWLFKRIQKTTRFEQDRSPLPNAFEGLRKLVKPEKPVSPEENAEDRPRFMIHAGDQIYYDIPIPRRAPEIAEYRRTYRQTWFEDEELRQLLRECPHYMIWDDHDIVDAFAQDGHMPGGRQPWEYFDPAWDAYREYVHCRQPGAEDGKALFYEFQYGATPFFVLDTRKERYIHTGEMISEDQMEEFKHWLCKHRKRLKFVVSSVAFLAELRLPEDRDDKWCSESFRAQRREILEHVYEKKIERLVFLVGDMHCAYHATMRLGRFGSRVILHELAGGPVYQLQFARRNAFYDQVRDKIEVRRNGGVERVPYATSLRRVHGAASSVLKIEALPSAPTCQVHWEVVETAGRSALVHPRLPTLSGHISF
jgi:hypothetical protein